jgi:hypothetical protein
MAGLYNRLKTWIQDEKLTYTDLNNEFNNVITNSELQKMKGHSDNTAQIQAIESPAPGGIPSVGTTISGADEIERLRYMIQTMTGKSNWYDAPATNFETLNSSLNIATSIFQNATTGVVNSYNYPVYLTCTGANANVTLDASPTPFACYIDGVLNTISVDTNLALGVGPGVSRTLGTAMDQFSGYGNYITVAGPGFASTTGREYLFKISEGGNTEYIRGTLYSATGIYITARGYAFSGANVEKLPQTFTTAATVQLLGTHWIFLKSDGTLVSTTNPPKYNDGNPTGPTAGDYYYNLTSGVWKTYTGAVWNTTPVAPIGIAGTDGTNVVCTRSNEFRKSYSSINTLSERLRASSSMISLGGEPYRAESYVSINGRTVAKTTPIWDLATDLASGESWAAIEYFFAYMDEYGVEKLSRIAPLYRGEDLQGWYHPTRMWRCLGKGFATSAVTFDSACSCPMWDWSYTLSGVSGTSITAAGTLNLACGTSTGRILLPPGMISYLFTGTSCYGGTTTFQTSGISFDIQSILTTNIVASYKLVLAGATGNQSHGSDYFAHSIHGAGTAGTALSSTFTSDYALTVTNRNPSIALAFYLSGASLAIKSDNKI